MGTVLGGAGDGRSCVRAGGRECVGTSERQGVQGEPWCL